MSEIYLIVTGEYSDHRVHYACTDRHLADGIAAHMESFDPSHGYGEHRVESVPLVVDLPRRVSVLKMWARIAADGAIVSETSRTDIAWPDLETFACRAEVYRDFGDGVMLEVQGTDHERVRKVYGDRRAQLMADDAYRAQIVEAQR